MADHDCEPSLELQLREILREDNVDKFLSALKDHYAPGNLPRDLVSKVCDEGATKCAKALLEEHSGYTFDIHDTIHNEHANWTPLHSASERGDLPFVSLLLDHGAQPNIRSSSSKRYFDYKFPLNSLLAGIKVRVFSNYGRWNPAKHIFRVIIILCLREMREKLEVLGLLVERTEGVEKEICDYVVEGKVIELAALLLAAREKVMSPSVFEIFCPTEIEGSMTWFNFCIKEIITLQIKKLGYLAKGHDRWARICQHQLALIMHAFQLLGIFERVGDRIHTYLMEERQNVSDQNVAKELASIFLDAGFPLKECDYNLSMFNWNIRYRDFHLHDRLLSEYSEEDSGKSRTPEHGKPDKQVAFIPTSFKHGSLTSRALLDWNCNYDRPQSLSEELEKLSNHEYLKDWNRRKSLVKLIYILCLPELQGGLLKSIRSLALDSEDTGKFSCLCLKEGKLVDLAVLLMVARERLLGKKTQNGDSSLSDSSITLRQCLTLEMTSAIYEEVMSKGTFQSNNLVQICKARKKLLSSAHLLVEVFESAGYRIDQYLQSDLYRGITSNLQVAKDVAFFLKEEGFLSSKGDFNLGDMKCFLTKLELEPEQAEKLRKLSERSPVRDIDLPSCFPVHIIPFSEPQKNIVGAVQTIRPSGRVINHFYSIFGSKTFSRPVVSHSRSFNTRRISDSSFGFMTSQPPGTQPMKIVKPLILNFLSRMQLTRLRFLSRGGMKHMLICLFIYVICTSYENRLIIY